MLDPTALCFGDCRIRRGMFMVGVCAGEHGIVRMRLWVLPVQFLIGAPNFVAVALDKHVTTVPSQ